MPDNVAQVLIKQSGVTVLFVAVSNGCGQCAEGVGPSETHIVSIAAQSLTASLFLFRGSVP